MRTNLRTIMSMILALLMLTTALSGCGTSTTPTTATTVATTAAATTIAGETTAVVDTTIKLPLTAEKVTYKVFYPINRVEEDMTKNELWKKFSEETGVYFEWDNPLASSGAGEAYNLMLASGNLPDMVIHKGAINYRGGFSQAITDGVYLDLKDMVQQYAPLYWEALSENPNVLRDALTDAGELPGIFQIAQLENDQYRHLMGMMLRGDWLEELNLPVPQTIDDWYTTLKAFKEEKGAAFPLLIGPVNGMESIGIFTSAFGITTPPVSQNATYQMFYPDAQGKMHYGGVEAGYQEFLQTMSKWYNEGLFDRDFPTRGMRDLPGRATVFGQGDAGAVAVYAEWTGMFYGSTEDKNMKMVAAPYPAKVAGEKQPIFIARSKYLDQPVCITTACKNPELLVSFFNYLTTDENVVRTNFGIENTDWTMVDGKPVFTDKIMKSELGVSAMAEVVAGGVRPLHLGAKDIFMDQANTPESMDAKNIWANSSDPFFCSYQLTPEEGDRLSQIMNDIVTYCAEETIKAYFDPAVADNWMNVQAKQIESMGVQDAIAIVQGAYDRFLSRK